jgi:alanine racemase
MYISNSILHQSRANRAVMTVDLAAIRDNINAISKISNTKKIMPIIKGDAYGIGAVEIALDLQSSNHAHAFGVDNVYEGLQLRQAGIELPILVLDGGIVENIPFALQYDLMPGISTIELLHAYNQKAVKANKKLSIWLYYNCGFNRSGMSDYGFFSQLIDTAMACSHIHVDAVYSHLTDSNNDPAFTLKQVDMYQQALNIAKNRLGDSVASSLYASHSIVMCQEQETYDWARPGLLLYGMHCFSDAMMRKFASSLSKFRLAIALKAKLISKIEFQEDTLFAYGQSNKIKKGERLGSVAIGFGNGIRQNSGQVHYAFNATKLPVYGGSIGMDYSQIKLPEQIDIPLYEWLTVFGDTQQGEMSPEAFAYQLGQSPYSFIRGINVARHYINSFKL